MPVHGSNVDGHLIFNFNLAQALSMTNSLDIIITVIDILTAEIFCCKLMLIRCEPFTIADLLFVSGSKIRCSHLICIISDKQNV